MQPDATNNLTLKVTLGKLLLLLALLFTADSALSAKLSGQVVSITSTNHILLQTAAGNRQMIGLAGIRFAPFTGRKRDLIKRHLHTLLAGRFVTVETTTPVKPGVILGRVRHGSSDIGLRLIRSGLAFTLDPNPIKNSAIVMTYKKAEAEARRYKMGYWQSR
jgi:hypothetical protein